MTRQAFRPRLVAPEPVDTRPKRQDLLTLHARRGWHVEYTEGDPRPCPGCGRSHWYIGRTTAECAFCGVALPIRRAMGGRG